MKITFALFTILLFSFHARGTFAQDPTMPGKSILALLGQQPTDNAEADGEVDEAPPLPVKIMLKAIVMRDADHGMALLEANEIRYRVPLVRKPLPSVVRANTGGSNSQPAADQPEDELVQPMARPMVQIEGIVYSIEDFTADCVILSDGTKRFYAR